MIGYIMTSKMTTISIQSEDIERLKELRIIPRESHGDVVHRVLDKLEGEQE